MLYIIEIISVGLSLLYLYLATRRKAGAWVYGTLASVLSIYLFFQKGYYGSMALNIIYTIQGIIGFMNWKLFQPDKQPSYQALPKTHILLVASCILVSFTLYKIFTAYNFAEFIYADLLFALGSIVATTLEIRKDTSCWWYWILCNLGYTILYTYQSYSTGNSLYLYALLSLVFTVFSCFALMTWTTASALKE